MEKIDFIKTILDSNAVATCGGHFVGAVISGSFWNTVAIKLIIEFEKVELPFDDGVTILAGANNSGKTSLIHLIKRVADYYTKRVD